MGEPTDTLSCHSDFKMLDISKEKHLSMICCMEVYDIKVKSKTGEAHHEAKESSKELKP